MSSVFSPALAAAISTAGGIAPLPRELPLAMVQSLSMRREWGPIVATTSPFRTAEVHQNLANPNIDFLILDTVAGHNEAVIALVESLPVNQQRRIIAGSIATAEAAYDFKRFELAAVRVGIGGGSICTTTEVTGVGVPQLQAISEVAAALAGSGTKVIADGGIRSSGDIAKALAAGADAVMMGRAFAATTEASGHVVSHDGVEFKSYAGAEYASIELGGQGNGVDELAVAEFRTARGHRSEGVSGLIHHSGSAALFLEQIRLALSAALAFLGARTIAEFQDKAVFQKVSAAAHAHGRAHGIDVVVERDRFFS